MKEISGLTSAERKLLRILLDAHKDSLAESIEVSAPADLALIKSMIKKLGRRS
jgi:hypothetical protein